MAGDKSHGRVAVAMGDRNAGVSKATDAGGNAGHNAEGNAVIDQGQRFFTAAAEDEGVAALEAQHALALARQLDEAQRNVGLFRRRLATALAGIFEQGAGTGEIENGFVDQCVIDDDIRHAQCLDGKHGQKTRIAGTGAGQPDPARLQIGQCRE